MNLYQRYFPGACGLFLSLLYTFANPIHAETDRTDDRSGQYLGASSAQVIVCLPGEAQDPIRGLTIDCTYHDLQKYGSMGRQIATSEPDHFINFSWTNMDNNSFTGGRNVKYSGFEPGFGGLCDGPCLAGVDIGPGLIPPDRSGFVTLAGASDGTAIAAFHWDKNFSVTSSRFKTYIFRNQTPTLGDFVGEEVDSVLLDAPICGFGGCQPPFNWPQIAYTKPIGGPEVRHLLVVRNLPQVNQALYARSLADSAWEKTATFDQLGYFRSPVIAASRQSRRVGIAFSAGRGDQTPLGGPINRINGELSGKNDNDIYTMTSEDAGATWIGPMNVTLRGAPKAGDWAPHAKLSVLFDSSDVFHVVWQAVQWLEPNSAFSTRSRMFHWDESSAAVRTAVDANWDPILCNGGENTLNVDNPQLSACDGNLYLTFTHYAPVPLGRGDDCASRAFSGDGNGAANGDIYVTVSNNGGFNWDAPRNLTNTYTPNCDTADATSNPDCDSDAWQSVTRYGIDATNDDFDVLGGLPDFSANIDPSYTEPNFLFMQYINDHDPGAAIRSEGGWTNNAIKTFRFGCVDIVPVAALASSLQVGQPVSDPAFVLPGQDSTIAWRLENTGNIPLTYSVAITNDIPNGNVTVTGGTGTIDNGVTNFESLILTLNANNVNTAQNASATIIITGSFISSPDTFQIDYCICDLQALTFDSLDNSLILGNNGNLGRRGNLGLGKLNLDFAGNPAECDTTNANVYLYDASPIVSYNGNVVTSMFSDNIADPHKFRPLTEPIVDCDGAYFHANSGVFTTQDSALGLTADYWTFDELPLVSGSTWRTVYARIMYWNNTSEPIDSVFCAYGLDWDVPSDTDAHNSSAIETGAAPTYVYQQGGEYGADTGNTACRDNSSRYAATIYWPPSFAGEEPYTNAGNGVMGAGFQSLYTRDNESFITDDWNHAALDSMLHVSGFGFFADPFPNSTLVNLHIVLNSGAYRIDPDDTLALWLILLTGFGTQEEFESAAESAKHTAQPGTCCDNAGDADDNGTVNIADITFLIARIFADGPPSPCEAEASANGDDKINISDITFLINRIFGSGPAPVCGPEGSSGCQ